MPSAQTYVEEAANALDAEFDLHEVEVAPDLFSLYLLLLLVMGRQTSLGDVHDAWAVWTDVHRPGHRSLVPFHELSLETKLLDEPYANAIHAAAQRVGR